MTVNEFLDIIEVKMPEETAETHREEFAKIRAFGEDFLDRKTAAKTVAFILTEILCEDVEINPASDYDLYDIFSCKSCTGHILKAYTKGIIPGVSRGRFGIDRPVSEEEALVFAERIFYPDKRVVPKPKRTADARFITEEEIKEHIEKGENVLVIDVRKRSVSREEPYPGPIVNFPFEELYINPRMISFGLKSANDLIVTKCDFGYTAAETAHFLTKMGYGNVFFTKP